MFNEKIRKIVVIAITTVTVVGNTYMPVQAKTPNINKAPITKVVDCNKLTENMLLHRSSKKRHIMYIERVFGIVKDNKKNGKIINRSKDCGSYISYRGVKGAKKGDQIITYFVYNPYTNYTDDIIERWDFVQ